MSKIQKQQVEKIAVEYPILIARDFFIIKDELEKFAIDKEFTNKDGSKEMVHFVPVEGLKRWYTEKGALADREDWAVKDILLYKELENQMEQYESWNRRREFAQRKNPNYQDVVNNMRVGE